MISICLIRTIHSNLIYKKKESTKDHNKNVFQIQIEKTAIYDKICRFQAGKSTTRRERLVNAKHTVTFIKISSFLRTNSSLVNGLAKFKIYSVSAIKIYFL